MKITWLGQLGLLIEGKTSTVMVDPYLTDSLFERVGERCRRLVPPDEKYLDVHPDMLLLTHDHSDHLDVPSLRRVLDTDKRVDVLCSANAWKKARSEVGGGHNYISVPPGTEWSREDCHVRAVSAVHSDETAVGYLLHMDGVAVYISGDTLYDERIVREINESIDVMFVVMNGVGNNMNYIDAVRMAQKIAPKLVIPVHWGLFEAMSAPPEPFLALAEKSGLNCRIVPIYGSVDTEEV